MKTAARTAVIGPSIRTYTLTGQGSQRVGDAEDEGWD